MNALSTVTGNDVRDASDAPCLDSDVLLLEMIMALVDKPEEVKIDREPDPTSPVRTVLTIHVDPSDYGKIIGKEGRTIGGIRNFFNSVTHRVGQHLTINMANEKNIAKMKNQTGFIRSADPKLTKKFDKKFDKTSNVNLKKMSEFNRHTFTAKGT